jgi:hypothetical protein
MHPYKRELKSGVNNELFGDGAVAAVQRADFVSRWYAPSPIGW